MISEVPLNDPVKLVVAANHYEYNMLAKDLGINILGSEIHIDNRHMICHKSGYTLFHI